MEPVTWGYMKSWAASNRVPDNARMMTLDGDPVVDLGSGTEDDGSPYFTVELSDMLPRGSAV